MFPECPNKASFAKHANYLALFDEAADDVRRLITKQRINTEEACNCRQAKHSRCSPEEWSRD